jgi:hypothetical protein
VSLTTNREPCFPFLSAPTRAPTKVQVETLDGDPETLENPREYILKGLLRFRDVDEIFYSTERIVSRPCLSFGTPQILGASVPPVIREFWELQVLGRARRDRASRGN